jgi:hypothetical protein
VAAQASPGTRLGNCSPAPLEKDDNWQIPRTESTRGSAGSQIFHCAEPVFLRRSVWTASRLPVFIGEGRDLSMSECGDAMSNRGRRWSVPLAVRDVLQGLPGMLVSSEVILFSLVLGNTMGVRRAVV